MMSKKILCLSTCATLSLFLVSFLAAPTSSQTRPTQPDSPQAKPAASSQSGASRDEQLWKRAQELHRRAIVV
ncbi:MAG: hypothetical protein M3430_15285, partial [Acidobacteriota bacterium]|nr:hypothetical protein [Acidobacteriota bacterium]